MAARLFASKKNLQSVLGLVNQQTEQIAQIWRTIGIRKSLWLW